MINVWFIRPGHYVFDVAARVMVVYPEHLRSVCPLPAHYPFLFDLDYVSNW